MKPFDEVMKQKAIDKVMEEALVRTIICRRFETIQNSVEAPTLREKVWEAVDKLWKDPFDNMKNEFKGTVAYDYLYGTGVSEASLAIYYDNINRFSRAWFDIFKKIDLLLKTHPTWDFESVYNMIHICDNCGIPVLEGHCTGGKSPDYYCSTECMLLHVPFRHYVSDYIDEIAYYSESNLEHECLGLLGDYQPYDENGRALRVGSIVRWNDPAIEEFDESDREWQASRRWEIIKIYGETIHLWDPHGEVEVLEHELTLIKY